VARTPRRPLLRLAAVLLGGAAATAQVECTATSLGLQSRAGTSLGPTITVGTDVGPGAATTVVGPSGDASVVAVHTRSDTAIELRRTTTSRAFGSSTSAAGGAVEYRLRTAQPFVGQLVVGWSVVAAGTGSTTMAIDLHGDGSVEANGAAVLPVAFGPGELVLRVLTSATASAGSVPGFGSSWTYHGTARRTLVVRLEATHCVATPFGNGCGEPLVAGTGNLHGGAEVVGVCAPEVDCVVAAFGFAPQLAAVPLPPGCVVHLVPTLTWWGALDANHRASWSFGLPASLRPVSLLVQLVALDADTAHATTSAGLQLDCH
jgi:hypothetical protein